ncbi:MAG: ImmA/IrrE family metallo-endopeptidase [Gammaproteobacteria bacterium]|nr:ImmA/IrrE family metallo-endopeptidase [Gammaproteobacteria bacterium]
MNNLDIEKWKIFIDDEDKYSVDAGCRYDFDSFMREMNENDYSLEWSLFPLDEIVSREWVDATLEELKTKPKQIFDKFIDSIGSDDLPQSVLFRKTFHKNTNNLMNDYALLAWSIRVVSKAFNECCTQKYDANFITEEFLIEVAQLSQYEDGPLRAKKLLADNGIAMVIEKSLPGAIFNGAAIPTRRNMPVIGLTLQYDRIDNFWFTLLHELTHVWKHFDDVNELYIDFFGSGEQNNDSKEDEANAIAGEALIPKSYLMHDAFILKTNEAVESLAKELNISPAIVAGRIQFDLKQYNILRKYVDVPVRSLFTDVSWN